MEDGEGLEQTQAVSVKNIVGADHAVIQDGTSPPLAKPPLIPQGLTEQGKKGGKRGVCAVPSDCKPRTGGVWTPTLFALNEHFHPSPTMPARQWRVDLLPIGEENDSSPLPHSRHRPAQTL
eukprot:5120646-Amphidinium_carterae.2